MRVFDSFFVPLRPTSHAMQHLQSLTVCRHIYISILCLTVRNAVLTCRPGETHDISVHGDSGTTCGALSCAREAADGQMEASEGKAPEGAAEGVSSTGKDFLS